MAPGRFLPILRYATIEFLLLSAIVLIWVYAYHLTLTTEIPYSNTDKESLYALLFAAATVSFFIISFLVALLAIFGWSWIERQIEKAAGTKAEEKMRTLSNELSPLIYNVIGYMLGEMSCDFDAAASIQAQRDDQLKASIRYFELASNVMDGRPGIGVSKLDVLNNIVFYNALRDADADFVLGKAELLRKEGFAADIDTKVKTSYKLSYCRAMLRFSSNPDAKRDARVILEKIANSQFDTGITDDHRREAEFCLAAFP